MPANDFVFMSLQSWDKELGSNARDIALELARTHRVLFVCPPDDWLTRLRGQRREAVHERPRGLVQVQSTLWVLYPTVVLSPINGLPDGKTFDFFNWYNNRVLAKAIQACMRKLNFGPALLLNDSSLFRGFYLKEMLRPALYIYYTRDNLLAVPFWQRHGRRLEPELMQKADLVVGNSAYLIKQASVYNANAVDIGQGCELTQFDAHKAYPVPTDLAGIPTPRIGYTGALTSLRLDISLLEQIAHERPHWQLVLIGPEDDAFKTSMLHTLPNVWFLGLKTPAELPAYMHHLQVMINPQVVNEVTIGNYPRKVDEYLAMGKPVVAVETDTMAIFDKHVLLARTIPEFIQQIDRCLSTGGPSDLEARVSFAREHSWTNSVGLLLAAIQQTTESTVNSESVLQNRD